MINSDPKKLKQTIAELERRLESAEARSQELHEEKEILEERLVEAEACIAELETENLFLRRQVTIDGLTGIHNRKFFDEEAQREFLEARRRNELISIVMIDVDNFKGYNDSYGHPAGDEVLQRVARSLKNILHRPSDIVCRYGGEEFVYLLPNTNGAGSELIAERAREAIERLRIPHLKNNGVVTISLGVATLEFQDLFLPQLLKRADEYLYKAKTCGRNRVYCD